jgi:hypothetical protein
MYGELEANWWRIRIAFSNPCEAFLSDSKKKRRFSRFKSQPPRVFCLLSTLSHRHMDPSVVALLTALVLNGAIALVLYSVYSQTRNKNPKVYESSTSASSDKLSLDAKFMLIYVKTALYLFAACSLISLPILIPVNAINQLGLPGLDLLSLSNVSGMFFASKKLTPNGLGHIFLLLS